MRCVNETDARNCALQTICFCFTHTRKDLISKELVVINDLIYVIVSVIAK
jgi:hypothetical protein